MSDNPPDLKFYFSVENNINAIPYDNNIAFNTVLENVLYAERELINEIGNLYTNRLEFKKNGSNIMSARILQRIFSFNFGSFVGESVVAENSSNNLILFPDGTTLNPDTYVLSSITFGNGDFFGSTGSIVFLLDKTPVREVLVYFSKK
jgi:hypothetical protein